MIMDIVPPAEDINARSKSIRSGKVLILAMHQTRSSRKSASKEGVSSGEDVSPGRTRRRISRGSSGPGPRAQQSARPRAADGPQGGGVRSETSSDDDASMSERRSRRGRRPRGGASKTTTTGVDGDHYDDVDDAASTTTTTERVPSPSPSPSSSSSTTTFREDVVVAVIVDAKNVRGKTGFELDHADLLDRLLDDAGGVGCDPAVVAA